MKKYTYKPGDWLIICHVCGFRIYASQTKHRWDGLLVCEECWETRHPQDLIRVPQEDTSVRFYSPEILPGADEPVFVFTCSITDRYAQADVGRADCATIGTPGTETVLPQCTLEKKTGIAFYGVAGCMLPNYNVS